MKHWRVSVSNVDGFEEVLAADTEEEAVEKMREKTAEWVRTDAVFQVDEVEPGLTEFAFRATVEMTFRAEAESLEEAEENVMEQIRGLDSTSEFVEMRELERHRK